MYEIAPALNLGSDRQTTRMLAVDSDLVVLRVGRPEHAEMV